MELSEGELWWASPAPAVGREQGGRRPVVIVNGQEYHETVTSLVLSVPVTSRDRGWANHVHVEAGTIRGWAMTEQVRAISRDRLVQRIGAISAEQLAEIRGWIADYLR